MANCEAERDSNSPDICRDRAAVWGLQAELKRARESEDEADNRGDWALYEVKVRRRC
jgi:hypothetical protein